MPKKEFKLERRSPEDRIVVQATLMLSKARVLAQAIKNENTEAVPLLLAHVLTFNAGIGEAAKEIHDKLSTGENK